MRVAVRRPPPLGAGDVLRHHSLADAPGEDGQQPHASERAFVPHRQSDYELGRYGRREPRTRLMLNQLRPVTSSIGLSAAASDSTRNTRSCSAKVE